MNKIDLMINEIYLQKELLPAFYNELKNNENFGLLENENKEIIFTGCGDSYAASMIMQEITGNKCLDPYELLFKRIHNEQIFVISSVSGKTIANINLAKKAKEKGAKIIVVTGNDKSELAKYADKVISISYKEPVILPGTLSFTKTILCLYSLFKINVNFNEIFNKDFKEIEKEFYDILKGSFYIISTPYFYPLSIYWKAKIFEITGFKAIIEKLEQFSHMDIFSLKNDDIVIIIGKSLEKAKLLEDYLKKFVYVKYLTFDEDLPTAFIKCAIYAQIFAATIAKNNSQIDFYFANSPLLEISNKLIY